MPPAVIQRSVGAVVTIAVAVGLVLILSQVPFASAPTLFGLIAVGATFAAAGVLVWYVDPAYIFCAALFLSPVSGNWDQLGIPGYAAPDRLLLIAAIGAVLLRAPGSANRPPLKIAPVHWLMLVTVLYAAISAAVVGTLFVRDPFFKLLEPFGILPFLLFLTAPLAFRTTQQRDVLLRTFVILGAYLGLTTVFEALHADALVWPKFILDPSVGIHAGRGRGIFVEAVTNGYAQYVCAVACCIAAWRWRERRRLSYVVVAVALLDLAGAFMSTERSVWLGAVVATVIGVLALDRRARRWAPAAFAGMALAVVAALAVVPGLQQKVDERSGNKTTIWDRKNLNRAAINMVEARPTLGFGWAQYLKNNKDYFEQSKAYPLTRNVSNVQVHSTLLTYAVELGLIGLLLWVATLVTGVGGALATRGPPDLRMWRIGLLTVASCTVIVTNFVPPSVFPSLAIWLWASVCWSGRYPADRPVAAHADEGAGSARPAG